MSHAIQAVIWDLDGVIIDSAEAHLKAWYRLAADLGYIHRPQISMPPLGNATMPSFPNWSVRLHQSRLKSMPIAKKPISANSPVRRSLFCQDQRNCSAPSKRRLSPSSGFFYTDGQYRVGQRSPGPRPLSSALVPARPYHGKPAPTHS